jgi:hypothetical protein
VPNWIYNKLYVNGPIPEVRDFAYQARYGVRRSAPDDVRRKARALADSPADSLSFSHFVSLTARQPGEKRGRSSASRARTMQLWGTKWDAYGPRYHRTSRNRIWYGFLTAWDPPFEWLRRTSAQYPRLRFSLHVHGEGWSWMRAVRANAGEFDHEGL